MRLYLPLMLFLLCASIIILSADAAAVAAASDTVLGSSCCAVQACRSTRYLSRTADFFVRDDQDVPLHTNGLHIGCVCACEEAMLGAVVWENGIEAEPVRFSFRAHTDFSVFRSVAASALRLTKETNDFGAWEKKQDWRAFNPSTQAPIERTEDLLRADGEGMLFIAVGGQFVWPGVRVGHVHSLAYAEGGGTRHMELETLSMQPLVFRIRHFLRSDECEQLIGLSRDRLADSGVSKMDKDLAKDTKEWRTSTQAWVHSQTAPFIAAIDDRVAALTAVPKTHQEHVQVLKYDLGQFYAGHLDAWDPYMYRGQPDMMAMIDGGHANRFITVFWYMSDVEEGGHTSFPRAMGKPQPADMWACQGLMVKPEKGAVIMWYNLLPNGNVDPNSLHNGCSVLKGEKWAANKWVWNKHK